MDRGCSIANVSTALVHSSMREGLVTPLVPVESVLCLRVELFMSADGSHFVQDGSAGTCTCDVVVALECLFFVD